MNNCAEMVVYKCITMNYYIHFDQFGLNMFNSKDALVYNLSVYTIKQFLD